MMIGVAMAATHIHPSERSTALAPALGVAKLDWGRQLRDIPLNVGKGEIVCMPLLCGRGPKTRSQRTRHGIFQGAAASARFLVSRASTSTAR